MTTQQRAMGLEVRRLNTWYDTAHVLFDVDLTVPAGRTVAVLGRNGAGKTTLLRSIARGLVRTTGEIRYGDVGVDKLRPDEAARRGIQLVPEDRRIFTSLTVRQNLDLGQRNVRQGQGGVSVDGVIELFPMLDALLMRPGFQLSGGEQQLLAIARAMMVNPTLLLLDEPCEGLAPRIVEEVATALRSLKSRFDLTIVLAEQNVRFATQLADDVCVIDDGRVAFYGDVSEFRARPDIRDRYLKI